MPDPGIKFIEIFPRQRAKWYRVDLTLFAPPTYPWDNLTGLPACFPPCSHNHDDRYYTKAQIDAMIGLASDYWVDTQVELTALPMPTTKTFRIMRGLNAVGDGQIQMVLWMAASMETPDSIDVFIPDSMITLNPGRWERFI